MMGGYLTLSVSTEYYVAKSGHDSNSGTEISPFRTIKQGASSLSAGDTLYVRGGTYREIFILFLKNLN